MRPTANCLSCIGASPAGMGNAGGLISPCWSRKSAPSTPHSGEPRQRWHATIGRAAPKARAQQSATFAPAVEAGLSSAADCGSRAGACLSAASSRQTPQAASSARNRAAALTSARLSLLTFFGEAKKVSALSGAQPDLQRQPKQTHNTSPTESKIFAC